MKDWAEGEIRWIALEAIGERYRRYRLPDVAAEAAMAGSLGRYGQLSPLAVCLREERPEVLDGFKRVAAGRTLPAVTSLQARLPCPLHHQRRIVARLDRFAGRSQPP